MRIKQGERVPKGALVCGVRENGDGGEFRFLVARLPSWQFMEDFMTGLCQWHQLVFVYHGLHGFSFHWESCLGPSDYEQ